MVGGVAVAGNNVLLSNAKECLVVVMDVQQKLTAAMPNGVRERVLARINILLTTANTLSVPIMVTEQYPKGLGHTEPALSEQLTGAVPVIGKTSFSAMNATGFAEHVEQSGRKQIILVGMETHICILQTALDMQAAGFQVFVVEDAVSSRSKANQYNALQRLRGAGVIVTNVESVFFEWLGDAHQAAFKALAELII
jgi:nicotinamidase-related amidase